MPVYFISEDENGCSPIEIGVAKNIEARKRNLQTGTDDQRYHLATKGWSMIYIWHVIAVWFIFNAGTEFLAGDHISDAGRKLLPTSLLISVVYLVSLFFIY